MELKVGRSCADIVVSLKSKPQMHDPSEVLNIKHAPKVSLVTLFR